MKQYIFTMVFGLLLISASASNKKTYYYVGVWDGNVVQINNPSAIGKNHFCIHSIRVNGKKIKTNYKMGGIQFNPSDYGFKEGQEFLIAIDSKKDCEPSFNSKGFTIQR